MNKEEIEQNQEEETIKNEENNSDQDSKNEKTEDLSEDSAENTEKTAEEKYSELYDKYLRLYSEFENFRKRTTKERSELIKAAGAQVTNAILPVLDDLDRAIKNLDNSDEKAVKQAIEMIFNKLNHNLGEKGLEVLNPIGEAFDPEQHEAITKLPAPSKKEKNTILDVTEKGYKLNDIIIRYPKVVVYI